MAHPIIAVSNYLTANGSYPERIKNSELTPELLDNAHKLITQLTLFFNELGYTKSLTVTSGFRPSAVNANTAGSAKRSLHMQCLAVDFLDDKNQTLAKLCASRPDLLKKHGLFLENPDFTKGKYTNWCHLDISPTRPDRPSRMFNP